ncbi:MAG: GNAT family N-acetyltransferase, partial [Nitrosomonas sp.]|nr:GNAT family N-acetyltransferase [Nitrosomonas sp.]
MQAAVRDQQLGQYETAEAFCRQVCEIAPKQPDALHLLAVIHAQTGRYQEANHYFIQAITSDPSRADFLSNYANALWEQGQIEEAIIHCERSLAIDARRADTHNILGNIFLSQHRWETAITCFRQALALQPNYCHALNNLGNALQKQDKTEEAITCYKKALKLQENYPEAHNNLGQALKKIDKIDEARQHFIRAVALKPGFYKAQQNAVEVAAIWLEPLDGKKLHLRRYRKEDAAFLSTCYQNDIFMAQYNHYIPRHQYLTDLQTKLQQAEARHPCQSKSIDWIIQNKSTGEPLGIANLAEIQFAHRRAEFLVGLPNTENHVRGIGLEAVLLILDYVFNRVGLNKLTTIVYG